MATAEMRLIYPEWDLMIRMAEQYVSGNIPYLRVLGQDHCICQALGQIHAHTVWVWKHGQNSYYPSLKWNIINRGKNDDFLFVCFVGFFF